jgi:chorismate mutase
MKPPELERVRRSRIAQVQACRSLYQPYRENEVLSNAECNNPGPLTDAAIRRLFERIIDEARAAERDAMHSSGGTEKNEK